MINKPPFRLRPLLLLLLCLPPGLYAQPADTLSMIREFIQVCQSYHQLPLQLRVIMTSSANIQTEPEDSAHLEAAFYVDAHDSYTRIGELEQIANDSLLLLVSHQAQQMMLYTHRQPVVAQLQSISGFYLKDSSLAGFARSYTIAAGLRKGPFGPSASSGQARLRVTSSFNINSRALLPAIALSRESIQVLYDPDSHNPVEVVQTRRSLVPTDSVQYGRLLAEPAWTGKLVAVPDQGWWMVKETTTVFTYTAIAHKKNLPLPARVSDRVLATAPGVYAPVKQYEHFVMNPIPEESGR